MAFKKARNCNLCKENNIISESVKEISNCLSKSRKQLIIMFVVLSVTGSYINSHSAAISVPNELKQQLISISKNNKTLVPLNTGSINPVSENLTDNLPNIKPGQPLVIIPKNLKTYAVKKGDSPVKISKIFNISLKKLISANPKVDFLNLKCGEKLVIPETVTVSNRDHRYKLASRGFSPSIGFSQDRYFRWPTENSHEIVSGFGLRGAKKHLGIDISGKYGATIKAAKPGVVSFAGQKGNYGQCIIIDHGYGIQTLYAHASKLLIKAGEYVDSGQEIAKIGTTGRATGPHLHFQVMLHGVPKNPETYLKS